MSLTAALALPTTPRGYTIYLRGGTYSGDFTSTLVGTASTIRPYPGEHAIINGSLTINGADTIWQDIEIMYSGWQTRISAFSGSAPADIPTGKTLSINGQRTTMRRCTLHDLAGPGFWTAAVDGVMDECIFFNNGWDAPDRGHGHGLYMQNKIGTKTIKRCVFAQGYSDYSIHTYTEGGSIQGFAIEECVSIAKTLLIGGYTPVDRLTMLRTILFGGVLLTGYQTTEQNGSAALIDTILANGATHETRGLWASLTETGTDTKIGDRVLVYGGLVVVLNESRTASVIAPISGRYTNAQNPAEFVVLSQGQPLPMTGWTVATPIAASAPLATWDSRFGVFLVEDL